ncbi:MAG: prolyl oligopeptidase family serine peptidase [Gemmataceae bacterium]
MRGGILIGSIWSIVLVCGLTGPLAAEDLKRETVEFRSNDEADGVPERFRLAPHSFEVTREPWLVLEQSGITVTKLRFPSAVKSPHPLNNTVHAEYFQPIRAKSSHPAVIVLDILDGKQIVSRGEAIWLAQHDIPALVVYMAYYGPRRDPQLPVRMLMPDIEHSVSAMRQTVLDCRRAAAWLAQQPGVDPERLGVVGTSLGSFVAGLTAAAEPRIKTACLLLSGGGLVDAFYDHPKAAPFRTAFQLIGGSKQKLAKLIDPLDPLTYAKELSHKKLLFIAARRDDVVPPSAAERLWNATGKPPIVWVDSTHVGAAVFLFQAMNRVVEHIENPGSTHSSPGRNSP